MIALPPLDPRATWSVRILDADTGEVLSEHEPHTQCETASIGKVFLLLEVARRLESGALAADERIDIPDEHRVEDSGLLYRMRDQRVTVHDAALLVGAVSDNLATNALIHLCGLDAVRAVAPALGYRDHDAEPPDEFGAYDEDIETEHQCPKCGYVWSGKPA